MTDNIIFLLKRSPIASFFFLAILITYLVQMVKPSVMERFGFNPYIVRTKKQFDRFLTSMFVHANLMHLAFNLISYFFFAFPLEIIYLGSLKFLLIVVISQISAQLYDYYRWKHNPNFWSVGASGAISGLIFSYIAFSPSSTIYLFFVPMPAWIFGILFIAYSAYAGKSYAGGINHFAHLFGALSGFILTLILEPLVINKWLRIFG